ncbi:helix-turn-helix domain-containing protein [Pseudomonas sp. 8BK]|uniref:helix-turn-helix domain-containing protein n=1 Tax=Pseudomonas sp. 8BK TaxID=2653164 RepID=UPI00135BA900|nr:helix-turn-helix transcriptional regulator [Pseudomonas sp. 8BK]
MNFEKVLGEVVRDVRIRTGLPHEAFAETISASHLRQVEKGLTVLRIDTLVALCNELGVSTSQILLVAEARQAGVEVEGLLSTNNKKMRALLASGRFDLLSKQDAKRGLRGQRADTLRTETARLQAQGLSRAEVAKKLDVDVRTIRRYWVKPEESE